MITNQFIHTCDIWRKDTTKPTHGGKAADNYTLFESDTPCLLLQTTGQKNMVGETGRNLTVDAFLRIETQIYPTDRIVISSYNYVVHQVKEVIDLITEQIEYYEAPVEKQRISNEEATAIIKE